MADRKDSCCQSAVLGHGSQPSLRRLRLSSQLTHGRPRDTTPLSIHACGLQNLADVFSRVHPIQLNPQDVPSPPVFLIESQHHDIVPARCLHNLRESSNLVQGFSDGRFGHTITDLSFRPARWITMAYTIRCRDRSKDSESSVVVAHMHVSLGSVLQPDDRECVFELLGLAFRGIRPARVPIQSRIQGQCHMCRGWVFSLVER